jgi:hypothetical protein
MLRAAASQAGVTRRRLWELGASLALVLLVTGVGGAFFHHRHLNEQLAEAIDQWDSQRVALLVDRGAQIRGQGKESGATVLDIAVMAGDPRLVNLCLARGVPGDRVLGGRPLLLAAEAGHVEIIRKLLASGAPVNGRDVNGSTALMWAAANGRADAVRVLLRHGARVSARANDGSTALEWAREGQYRSPLAPPRMPRRPPPTFPAVFRILKQHGAARGERPRWAVAK